MHAANKLIIKRSVEFYSKAWKHRCDVSHGANKCKEFVHNQHKNVKEKIEKEHKPKVVEHVRMQEIDLEQCDVAHAWQQTLGVLNIRKIAKEEKRNDVR